MTPSRPKRPAPAPGILLVDKDGGMTSHDVVARARRALGTRKIGHAGTLDPMATGLLVLGVEAATRLLTYIVGLDKTYEATIRLGESTDTDDADGQTIEATDAAGVASDDIAAAIANLTGEISQVPSTYSAIKVDGRRAYDLARAGEQVELKARTVTVSRFDVIAERRHGGVVDLDVVVDCTSGTYIRSLARDLGRALDVGGHLTALRRTRIGPFAVADAVPTAVLLDAAASAAAEAGRDTTETPAGASTLAPLSLLAPADAATTLFGRIEVTEDEARDLRHGKRLVNAAVRLPASPTAAIDPAGVLIGMVEKRGADIKSSMNMPTGDAK